MRSCQKVERRKFGRPRRRLSGSLQPVEGLLCVGVQAATVLSSTPRNFLADTRQYRQLDNPGKLLAAVSDALAEMNAGSKR